MAEAEADQIVEALVESSTDEMNIDSERVPVRIAAGKKALGEHQRILNRLGVAGGVAITQHELERYLQDNHYQVYPLASVQKYMGKKVAEIKTTRIRTTYRTTTTRAKWRWVPMRKGQATRVEGGTALRYYRKTVPVEVLMTAEKIFNDLGDRVVFEVSEIYKSATVLNTDPFLAVTAPGLPKYVIERWDEPSFRR